MNNWIKKIKGVSLSKKIFFGVGLALVLEANWSNFENKNFNKAKQYLIEEVIHVESEKEMSILNDELSKQTILNDNGNKFVIPTSKKRILI